jgi:hypothetical protein
MCEGAPGTFRRRGQAIGVYWLAIAAAMTLAMAVWRNGAMQRRFVAKDIIVVFYNEAFYSKGLRSPLFARRLQK